MHAFLADIGLAIVVAIIGLFGLSTFMAEQRKKEMGIRKVLGANAGQLFLNLLKNFTLLILISCVVAIPLAYLITENWLNEFLEPYKEICRVFCFELDD